MLEELVGKSRKYRYFLLKELAHKLTNHKVKALPSIDCLPDRTLVFHGAVAVDMYGGGMGGYGGGM